MFAGLRAVLLGGMAVLTAAGLLPGEVEAVVRENADAVVSGVTGAWAIFAGLRAWREREERASK